MKKLQIGAVFIALSLSLQAPCALAGQLPQEDRQIKREGLEVSKMELKRRRARLVAHREELTRGLAEIEKQLTILNTEANPAPASVQKKASTLALSKELLEQARRDHRAELREVLLGEFSLLDRVAEGCLALTKHGGELPVVSHQHGLLAEKQRENQLGRRGLAHFVDDDDVEGLEAGVLPRAA